MVKCIVFSFFPPLNSSFKEQKDRPRWLTKSGGNTLELGAGLECKSRRSVTLHPMFCSGVSDAAESHSDLIWQ